MGDPWDPRGPRPGGGGGGGASQSRTHSSRRVAPPAWWLLERYSWQRRFTVGEVDAGRAQAALSHGDAADQRGLGTTDPTPEPRWPRMVPPQTRSRAPLPPPRDAAGQALLLPFGTQGSRGPGLAAARFTEERRSRRSSRSASARNTAGERNEKGAAGGAPLDARVPTAPGTVPNMATAGHVAAIASSSPWIHCRTARSQGATEWPCAVRWREECKPSYGYSPVRVAWVGSLGRPWGCARSTAQARRETRERDQGLIWPARRWRRCVRGPTGGGTRQGFGTLSFVTRVKEVGYRRVARGGAASAGAPRSQRKIAHLSGAHPPGE